MSKTTKVKYLKVGDIVKDSEGTYAVVDGGGYFTPGNFVIALQNTETKEGFTVVLPGMESVEVVGTLSKAATIKAVTEMREAGVIPGKDGA